MKSFFLNFFCKKNKEKPKKSKMMTDGISPFIYNGILLKTYLNFIVSNNFLFI
jgi:hypothetical protein